MFAVGDLVKSDHEFFIVKNIESVDWVWLELVYGGDLNVRPVQMKSPTRHLKKLHSQEIVRVRRHIIRQLVKAINESHQKNLAFEIPSFIQKAKRAKIIFKILKP